MTKKESALKSHVNALVSEGWSLRQIAAKYSTTVGTIGRIRGGIFPKTHDLRVKLGLSRPKRPTFAKRLRGQKDAKDILAVYLSLWWRNRYE